MPDKAQQLVTVVTMKEQTLFIVVCMRQTNIDYTRRTYPCLANFLVPSITVKQKLEHKPILIRISTFSFLYGISPFFSISIVSVVENRFCAEEV